MGAPAHLLQARRGALRKRLAGDIGERIPPPQCERLLDRSQLGINPGFGSHLRGWRGLGEQPLKADRVDGLGLDVERVASRPSDDRLPGRRCARRKRLPQVGDLDLERVRRVAGLVVTPQELHQRAGADRFTGVEQQSDEQRARDATPDLDLALSLLDTKRSEDVELHL